MGHLQYLLDNIFYLLPAVLISLSIHEAAHAYISYKFGDITQNSQGRMTLNPLKHLDPIGTICLMVFGFGWAKPVQVNPYFYRNKKEGMMWTALAGPLANILLAFLSTGVVVFIATLLPTQIYTSRFVNFIFTFFIILAQLNMGLALFNLIPIPPLDGSKILAGVLSEENYFKLMKYEQMMMIVVFMLLAIGVFDQPLMQARSIVLDAFISFWEMIANVIH